MEEEKVRNFLGILISIQESSFQIVIVSIREKLRLWILLDMKALAPEIFKEPGEIFCEIQCHHSQIILLGISRKISREIPDYNNPKKFLLNSSSHAIPPFFMLNCCKFPKS